MGNKCSACITTPIEESISLIVKNIIGVSFILILLFLSFINHLSKKCPCTCLEQLEGMNRVIKAIETKNLMTIKNHEIERLEDNTRLSLALESISDVVRRNGFFF